MFARLDDQRAEDDRNTSKLHIQCLLHKRFLFVNIINPSTRLIERRASDDVIVEHRHVERRDVRVVVRNHDEQRAVDEGAVRLDRRARVVAQHGEVRVRRVQLRDPRNILCKAASARDFARK